MKTNVLNPENAVRTARCLFMYQVISLFHGQRYAPKVASFQMLLEVRRQILDERPFI